MRNETAGYLKNVNAGIIIVKESTNLDEHFSMLKKTTFLNTGKMRKFVTTFACRSYKIKNILPSRESTTFCLWMILQIRDLVVETKWVIKFHQPAYSSLKPHLIVSHKLSKGADFFYKNEKFRKMDLIEWKCVRNLFEITG